MAYQVKWSPEAAEDLEDIAAYIEKDSPHYARTVVDRLVIASRGLKRFPLRGRVVPELGVERYRERFIYSYRMIYRVSEAEVLVVAVIHGKRLLENVEGRFEN